MKPLALILWAAPLLFGEGAAVPGFEPDPSNVYLGESFGQRALKWAYKGGLR